MCELRFQGLSIRWLAVLALLYVAISSSSVRAQEECFVSLSIKAVPAAQRAQKGKNRDVGAGGRRGVLVSSIRNVSSGYRGLAARSHPSQFKEDELVKVYTRGRRRVGKYVFRPAGPLMVDTFDAKTGPDQILIPGAESSLVLPYDPRMQKLHFMRRPAGEIRINRKFIKCRECIKAAKRGSYEADRCCQRLNAIDQNDGTFVCTACGDGKCVAPENQNNCRKDCPWRDLPCKEGTRRVGGRCE